MLDFAEWKCAASYVPLKDFLKDFVKLLLYFIEHIAITALNATRVGVNCNTLDHAMHEHLITASELAKLVEAVLDDLCPRDKSGQRVKLRLSERPCTGVAVCVLTQQRCLQRGPVINEAYFRQKHAELFKIAPLSVGSLFVHLPRFRTAVSHLALPCLPRRCAEHLAKRTAPAPFPRDKGRA